MLFTQIIAFVLVMVVYQAYDPAPPDYGWGWGLLLFITGPLLEWLLASLIARSGLRRLARPAADPARSLQRSEILLHLSALTVFFLFMVSYDLKAGLVAIPLLAASETLSGLAALFYYALLLIPVWGHCHRLERAAGRALALDRRRYILEQARFVAPVAFPWFLVSALRDLLTLAWPGLTAWLETPAGDLAFLGFFLLVISWLFPPLVRSWWGCPPLPPGRAREICQMVLKVARVRVGGILSWDVLQGRLVTAGILGLFPRFRYLLVTPALLEALSPTELAGVVAHEAGHVRLKHIPAYLMFFMAFFLLAYALAEPLDILLRLALLALAQSDWGAGLLNSPDAGSTLSITFALPLLALMIVYLRFVMGFFMRHFERQADLFALNLMGEAAPLVGALEKLALMSGQTRDLPSWHHFSVAQRVEHLLTAQADPPAWLQRQGRLIKKALAVYLAGMVLVLGLGWGMAGLDWSRQVNQKLALELVRHQLAQHPDDPRLRFKAGMLCYQLGREDRALSHFRRAFLAAPDNPELLNAMAWIFATSQDPRRRRPQVALVLARRAVSLSPLPHIWDTLAEAYFAAGQPLKALAAARAALEAGPKARLDYYRAQLERFNRAVEDLKKKGPRARPAPGGRQG